MAPDFTAKLDLGHAVKNIVLNVGTVIFRRESFVVSFNVGG